MAEERADIKFAVEEAILSYNPVRESRCPVEVSANDGRVELKGIVRTTVMRDIVERIAWNVPGVQEVVNNLLADTELEKAVAQRLAADEKTRFCCTGIRVKCVRGNVHLEGKVPDSQLREKVIEIARTTPGVLGVTNALS